MRNSIWRRILAAVLAFSMFTSTGVMQAAAEELKEGQTKTGIVTENGTGASFQPNGGNQGTGTPVTSGQGSGTVGNPTGESKDPMGESKDPTGESRDPTGESKDPTGESKDPTGETTEPTGESKDPTGETTEPTGETMEPAVEPSSLNVTMAAGSTAGTLVLHGAFTAGTEDAAVTAALRLKGAAAGALKPGHGLRVLEAGEESVLLQFSLSADAPAPDTVLTFAPVKPKLAVAVAPEDLTAEFTGEGNLTFGGYTGELSYNGQWQITAAAQDASWTGGAGQDLVYTVDVTAEAGTPWTKSQDLNLILPTPFSFGDGTAEFSPETGVLAIGGNQAAAAEGLTADCTAAMTVQDGTVLSLNVKRETQEETLPELHLTLRIFALALQIGAMPETVQVFALGDEGPKLVKSSNVAAPLTARLTSRNGGGKSSASGQSDTEAVISLEGSVKNYHTESIVPQKIYYVDNLNKSSTRPQQSELKPQMRFRMLPAPEGSGYDQFTLLTESNMKDLGLTEMPTEKFETINEGLDKVHFGYGGEDNFTELVVSGIDYTNEQGVTTHHKVEWQIKPQQPSYSGDNPGYSLVEVKDKSEMPSAPDTGWFYIQNTNLVFNMNLRSGKKTVGNFEASVRQNFEFHYSYMSNGKRVEKVMSLTDMTGPHSQMIPNPDIGGKAPDNIFKISRTWKYNLDGTLITYHIEPVKNGEGKPVEFLPGPPNFKDDKLLITYDNAAAVNRGDKVDAIYPDGMVILTLAGDTSYQATKIWLDDNSDAAKANRPGGKFSLWRYRDADSITYSITYEDAAQVTLPTALSSTMMWRKYS